MKYFKKLFFYKNNQHRKEFLFHRLSVKTGKGEDPEFSKPYCTNYIRLEQFPNKFRLFKKEYCILSRTKFQNSLLIDELLAECEIDPSSFMSFGFQKEFILKQDIQLLKNLKIIKKDFNITEKLLSYLEPFNYEANKKLFGGKVETIKTIRDSIEAQYLAWSFQLNYSAVVCIMKSLQSNLYIGRSMQSINVKKNIVKIYFSSKSENPFFKIFLMNIKPFTFDVLKSFEMNLVGYCWSDAVKLFPGFCSKPYLIIKLYLEILKSKEFSEKQIREALPFLKINLSSLLLKLNYILSNPKLSIYRTNDDFLNLLAFKPRHLIELVEVEKISYEEIIKIHSAHKEKMLGNITLPEIVYEIVKLGQMSQKCIENFKRHPQRFKVSKYVVKDTIKFLKEMEFTNEEIAESITIILYSRENIKNALEKIKINEDELLIVGIKNGKVDEETDQFSGGTKLKNKTLQLCLYYMELETSFSGHGVYQYCE